MSDLKAKLKQEQLSLKERISTLEKFIQRSGTYGSLESEHRYLLRKQLSAMQAYMDILCKRAALMKKPLHQTKPRLVWYSTKK